MPVSLAAVRQMIKNRQYEDARSALQAFLRDNPKSAEGWYLLSMAAETAAKRLAAARRAAKLAPKNARVMMRLDQLQDAPKANSGRGRIVLLIVALIALVIVGIAFIPRLIQSQNPATTTVVAAVSTSASATPAVTAEQTETLIPEAASTEEIVATPDTSATPNISATPNPSATPVTPTQTSTPTVTASPSAQPTTPAPTQTTAPPTVVPPTIPPPTLPPPTVIVPVGVVLNEAQEVGTGQMWIVAATRSAESVMRELGGFFDSAPPGYEWVLVEIFMICSGTANCAPPVSSLQVVGPSHTPYNVPAGFEIQPVFGPGAYVEGQVWGYLGYIIPSSESSLSLLFTQSGQQFAFDLQ